MFEDNRNNIDQDMIFRSILDEGQEPVPSHIWDGIETGLVKIEKKRKAVIWFRRSAIAIAAAAALAFGVIFNWNPKDEFVRPATSADMIAVVEPAITPEKATISQPTTISTSAEKEERGNNMLAMAVPVSETKIENKVQPAPAEEEAEADTPQNPDRKMIQEEPETQTTTSDSFIDEWPEEKEEVKKVRTSISLSGITGTNSSQNSNRVNPMKRPSISSAPKRTSIRETSTNTTYGIPLSFGIGVKFDFNEHWSLGTGINYTLLTRRFYGSYTTVAKDGSIINTISSDIRNSQHYLGIPVNVYYNILSNGYINLYTYAGGAIEKNIADVYDVMSTSIVHREKVTGIQLSANIGVGMEFLLGRHLGIYIDPSARYYFNCNQPKSIRTAQPLMFGFEMGIRARL